MKNNYEDEVGRARTQRATRELTSMNDRGSSRNWQAESRNREQPRSRGKNARRNAGTRASAAGAAGTGRPSGRRSGGSGGNGGRKGGLGRAKKIVILALAECITLFGIFFYAHAAKLWNSVQRPDFKLNNVENKELDVETVEKMKGYWTIAVFGVDSRGTNVGKGTNADVNMICNINQDTGEIKLVSVFRDSYLNINDSNHYNKLNMAYAQGGPEQAVKTLNKNLDLNITDYATFNWKAVADGINILGGIDMEISKAEFYYINGFITETVKATGIGSHHLKKAGMNHLDGVQAVAYGRLRLMDTDFARTERQRKVIEKAFEKAKNSNFSVLNNVMEVVFPQIATSLTFTDLTNLGLAISKYHISDTTGFPSARADANMGKKGACVVPATLTKNVTLLHQFLFGDEAYTPTSTVNTISAKISNDTGVYKEGQVINHVNTDGGYIPKETKAPETKETKEEEEEDEDEKETKKASPSNVASPGNSNRRDPTESSTAGRPGGAASGWETWATDENGNEIDPAWENSEPGESLTEPGGPVNRPGESASVPGESTAGRPNGPGETGGPGVTEAPATTQSNEGPGGGPGTVGTESPSLESPFSNGPSPGSDDNSPGVVIGTPGS